MLVEKYCFHYYAHIHRSVKIYNTMKEVAIQNRAGRLLEEVLCAVPTVSNVLVEAEQRLGDEKIDYLAEVWLKGKTGKAARHVLIVEVKANGQPRWARAAADVLDRHLRQAIEVGALSSYGVFVAPYVSESAAEVLRERGHGYLDLAGNGRLAFDGVFIERKGNPNRFSERSELRTLFSPKASRVLRILVMRPHEPWRMAALAQEADVSIGLVAKVKPLLLDREWAADTPHGLVLTAPGSALDAWATSFRRRNAQVHDYYGFGTVGEIEERLASAAKGMDARYALAEFSGTERVAPHVRYSRATAYIEVEVLEEVARQAELRPVETGPNVRVYEPYDDGVFFGSTQISGVEVAHPVQLYLDLKKAKGRGEEAADFLRRQVLEPAWTKSRRETSEEVTE